MRTLIKLIVENILFESETQEPIRKPFKMRLPGDLETIADIFKQSGMELYVVGGAVRDALIGKTPKDFDLVTNATPDEIIAILQEYPEYKFLEIGKAFGIVNVITPEGNEYEIARFREDIGKGRRPEAVRFSGIEQDVLRRDLSINALFYDIEKHEIVDYVGGLADLEQQIIRSVGNPELRFEEDPLRKLRAIRFAARAGYKLDPETRRAIKDDNSLDGISSERIRDEFIKSVNSAKSIASLFALYDDLDMWRWIFPGLQVDSNNPPETDSLPVLLATTLKSNELKPLQKKLNALNYNADEVRKAGFLKTFSEFAPENIYEMKKFYRVSRLQKDELTTFAKHTGMPDNIVQAFIHYEPSVDVTELLRQGYSGRELGDMLRKLEAEEFMKLLS